MPRIARYAPLFIAAVVLVVTSGCRTYGQYGNTEAIPAQMQQAVQQFADDLERAESDILALSEATAQNAALQPAESAYRDLIAKHRTFLEAHRAIAAEYEDGGDYRALNREYGAIISEQRLVSTRYAELHARVRRVVTGQPPALAATPESRYVVNPAYYMRVQNRQRLSMQDALRGL
jgi:hypothetical protein